MINTCATWTVQRVASIFVARWGLRGFQSPRAAIYWTGFVVAVSVALCLVSHGTRWRRASCWIALALAGQACSLQLLWVGPILVRPQEFYNWHTLARSWQGIFLVAFCAQTILVVSAVRDRWSSIRALRRILDWRSGLVFLVLEACASITIAPAIVRSLASGDLGRAASLQGLKTALGCLIFTVGALNLALAAAAVPQDIWEGLTARWSRLDRSQLHWACALWVLIISSLISYFAFARMPHIPDEVAYIFQAKYLATGHLYLPRGPDPQAFNGPFQLLDGEKWYNSMPAGWSFVLALGVLARVPWLVNPLLGALSVLLTYHFVRRLYDRITAEATVLLLSASPWLLFLSASFMTHALSLVLALVALLATEHVRETGSPFWAAVCGFGVGGLLHVRALEAVVLALVCGIWWLSVGWGKLRFSAVAIACVIALAMAGLFLAYNKALTNDPFQVPFNKFADQTYYKGANRLGFGSDVGNFGWTNLDPLPGHGPADVIVNTNYNLYYLNFETFGWSCGSLLFVFLLVVWREVRGNVLMLLLIFAIWAAMSLYWFSGGPDFGARYWYQMIVPLAVLTVRGAQILFRKLIERGLNPVASQRVWAFVVLASFLGMANLLPWRSLDKYHNYRGMRPDIRELERRYHFGRSLVLVEGPEWPDYAAAFSFNPPTLQRSVAGTIYARDLGPESNQRLVAFYADRPVWLVAGPSVTHGTFKVIAGPLTPLTADSSSLADSKRYFHTTPPATAPERGR